MILLLRALSRAMAFVLLAVLALGCLAAALFSIPPRDSGLPKLGTLARTDTAARQSGDFLNRLEGGGKPLGALEGAGAAALVGLVLVAGAVLPRRERTLELTHDAKGRIAARRRALQGVAAALARRPRRVTHARAHVRGRYRRRGGRLRLNVGRFVDADSDSVAREVRSVVSGLAGDFFLQTRVRTRRDEKERRLR